MKQVIDSGEIRKLSYDHNYHLHNLEIIKRVIYTYCNPKFCKEGY